MAAKWGKADTVEIKAEIQSNLPGVVATWLDPVTGVNPYIEVQLASNQQLSGSMSKEEVSRETWKRMLNNLPYLL